MFRSRKDADESPDHHLEAGLRALRRQVRNCRLFSDYQLQLGNEIHHELTVVAQCLAQGISPLAELRLALTQKAAHKALKGLRKGGVRGVEFVLIELARREET